MHSHLEWSTIPYKGHGCVLFAVSEIKVLFSVPTGCTSAESVHLGISPCTLFICGYNNCFKKHAHTGCTPLKIVHPAMKMCARAQGVPLISDTMFVMNYAGNMCIYPLRKSCIFHAISPL